MKGLFYKPVKVEGKNHQILFWGCLHYGHDPKWEIPIWKRRGFSSSQEHDEAIINNWNSKATDKTTGFLLGDIIFGFGGEEKFKKLMSRLNFQRVFVMSGNHYSGWHQAFESVNDNTLYVDGNYSKEVIFVPNYLEAMVNGQAIVCCHYPILSWNGAGKGSWMLFSHVHGSLGNSELGRMYLKDGGANLEVSVEATKFPLTYGEIGAIMKNKSKFKTDHHDGNASTPFS
jgi:calcineurin-like phosphoesterase family protein